AARCSRSPRTTGKSWMINRFLTWFFRRRNRPRRTRRYEILIPLTYNDGTAVEQEKLDRTADEMGDRFGGVTSDPVRVMGLWKHGGQSYRDDLLRFRVDTADPDAATYFRTQKEVWK